jgi:hypothetical protein
MDFELHGLVCASVVLGDAEETVEDLLLLTEACHSD